MKKIYFIAIFVLIGNLILINPTFSQKTWDGSSSNNWNTAANWTPSGVPSSTDAVIIPDNFSVTVNTAAVCASLTINGGSNDNTITISAGQSLTVSGAITINAGTGTGGGGDDKIIAVGSATLTCGSITMAATTDDAIDSEITISTGTVNVSGDITMNGTAARNAIRFSGAGTLNVGGNVAAGGDIVSASTTSGLVNYNGTSGDQTVKSDTYSDITFSGGASKTIATGDIIITDVATFTSGVVNSASGSSITFNNNATVSGSASNASYVDGPVTKIGDDNFTFPIGDPLGSYHYIVLNNTVAANASATTTDSYTAEFFRSSSLTRGSIAPGGLLGVSNCEHWSLTRSSGAGAPTVSVSWTADSPCGGQPYVTQTLGLVVAWLNGSNQWVLAPGTGGSPSGNATAGTATRNGVSNFGYFALGNVAPNGSPLPVKFSNIRAYEKMNGIQIDWTSFSETDVDRYMIERSANGSSFSPIGEVIALNSSNEIAYGFFDASPLPGISYYRLRNLDIDGKSGYSNIVRVDLRKDIKEIILYPNPARSGGIISYSSANLARGNYSARIFNAAGQQLLVQQFSHNGGTINQTIQLPASARSGYYTLQLELEGTRLAGKTFMVQ